MVTINASDKPRPYTFVEEIGNATSHGAMAAFVLCAISPTSIYIYLRSGALAAFGTTVFMLSIFLMFLSSALYHSMAGDTPQKQVIQILDHIFIYVAIAGTYTPMSLSVIGGWVGIAAVCFQWAVVIFGILYNSIARRRISKVSLAIYLIMGWSVVIIAPMFFKNADTGMLLLVFFGGVFYSAGTYFYSKKEKRFFHVIWHLFVNLGALCHFLGILLFL